MKDTKNNLFPLLKGSSHPSQWNDKQHFPTNPSKGINFLWVWICLRSLPLYNCFKFIFLMWKSWLSSLLFCNAEPCKLMKYTIIGSVYCSRENSEIGVYVLVLMLFSEPSLEWSRRVDHIKVCESHRVFLGLDYWSIYDLTLGTMPLVQPCFFCSFFLAFACVGYTALPAALSFCLSLCLGSCECLCIYQYRKRASCL